MIIVSNYLLQTTDLVFPEHAVIRLNLAWVKSKEHAIETLKGIKHEVYLDYPQGRTKPPLPIVSFEDAIEIAKMFPNVKYFAVSNVEDEAAIGKIRVALPPHIHLVPKIETQRGIKNLTTIMQGARTNYFMLDKEDLYMDVNRDRDLFLSLIEEARAKSKEINVVLLELQGVVFGQV
jgi:pyruvate kinase